MKRKLLAAVVAAVIGLSAVAMATPATDKAISGTVSRLDSAQKSMVVKTSDSGKEITVFWDDATRVDGGELREGSQVEIQAKDQDGKTLATSIQIRVKKAY